MSSMVRMDILKISRSLSWNSPVKRYYSDTGMVECGGCHKDVNLRDLVNRNGKIACKECKAPRSRINF